MKKGIPVLICGLATILVTVILYLAIIGTGVWGVIHFVTLFAVVVAEMVTTAYAYFSMGSVTKTAAAIFSGIMIPYSVIMSVVYIINFPFGYGKYLGWYFAGTIAANAVCLVLICFGSRKKKESEAFKETKSNMLMLRKLTKSITVLPEAQKYQKELYAIEEKLHFSNDCVICDEDEQIRLLLLQLKEKIQNSDPECKELIDKINLAADQRHIMSSTTV